MAVSLDHRFRTPPLGAVAVSLLVVATLAGGCRWPGRKNQSAISQLHPPAVAQSNSSPPATPPAVPNRSATAASVRLASQQTEIEVLPPVESSATPLAGQSTLRFTLADALSFGMQNNPRLREAAAKTDIANANADIAYAPYLPTIGAGYRYAGFNQPVLPGGSFVPASLTGGARSFSLAEAGIQWTLYDFGRTAGRYGQALDRARIEELAWVRARQTVAFDISRAYFELLASRATLRVREQAVRDAQSILDETRARRLGGVVDRERVLRADVELARTQEERLVAWQTVRDAESLLAISLGLSAATPIEVFDIDVRPPWQRSLTECLATAAQNRREIGMAREAVAEAERGVQAARGDMLPKVYVRGSVIEVNSPGPLNGFIEGMGLHVDQSLYTGGEHRGALRRSYAQTAAARAALQTVLDQVSYQVCVTYEAIGTNRQRIRLGVVATDQARENLRLTRVKYENGDATPTDVVDAQTALTRAENSYYSAVYGYLQGLSQLEFAQGNDQQGLLEQLSTPVLEELPPG